MLLRPAEEAYIKVLSQQLHLDNLSAMSYMMHGMWYQMMSTYNIVGAAVLLAWEPFNCSFIQGGICINNDLKTVHRIHLCHVDGSLSKTEFHCRCTRYNIR